MPQPKYTTYTRPLSLVWAHIEICHPKKMRSTRQIFGRWCSSQKHVEWVSKYIQISLNFWAFFPVETCPVLLLSVFRSPAAQRRRIQWSERVTVQEQQMSDLEHPGFFSGISMVQWFFCLFETNAKSLNMSFAALVPVRECVCWWFSASCGPWDESARMHGRHETIAI